MTDPMLGGSAVPTEMMLPDDEGPLNPDRVGSVLWSPPSWCAERMIADMEALIGTYGGLNAPAWRVFRSLLDALMECGKAAANERWGQPIDSAIAVKLKPYFRERAEWTKDWGMRPDRHLVKRNGELWATFTSESARDAYLAQKQKEERDA